MTFRTNRFGRRDEQLCLGGKNQPQARHVSDTDWQRQLEAGIRAVEQQRGGEAAGHLEAAVRQAPQSREARYWLANARRLNGQPAGAESLLVQLLAEQPGDENAAFALAYLLREQGQTGKAAEALLSLARHQRHDLTCLLKVSGFLRDSHQAAAAISTMNMALQLAPGDAGLHFRVARLHQSLGQFEPALDHYRNALDADPGLGGAWLNLAQLQRFESRENADWQRIQLAAQSSLGPEADMCLAFARGKALDDLGSWGDAWQAFVRGNRLRHQAQPWDRSGWHRQRDTALQPVAASHARQLRPARGGRQPVYIMGMLRSGTTLLEQLLDRHERITGRGELNFLSHLATRHGPAHALSSAERSAIADELWTHLQLDGPGDHIYIDKNPLNFRFVGFLLTVMPEAKILHLSRDGRDSCLSCFCQLFQHADAGFANRLDDLEDYYAGYRSIMSFWQDQAPERIHSLAYEDLVTAPAATLKTVLGFLGLEWTASMDSSQQHARAVRTASSWQARQPVHQASVARWQHYRQHAPEFFDALAATDRRYASDGENGS